MAEPLDVAAIRAQQIKRLTKGYSGPDCEIEPHPCQPWHRRMYARFKDLDLTHTKGCGRPWREHTDEGECPTKDGEGNHA